MSRGQLAPLAEQHLAFETTAGARGKGCQRAEEHSPQATVVAPVRNAAGFAESRLRDTFKQSCPRQAGGDCAKSLPFRQPRSIAQRLLAQQDELCRKMPQNPKSLASVALRSEFSVARGKVATCAGGHAEVPSYVVPSLSLRCKRAADCSGAACLSAGGRRPGACHKCPLRRTSSARLGAAFATLARRRGNFAERSFRRGPSAPGGCH